MKGGPCGAIQKFQKKSHSAEKNLSEKHQDSQRGDVFLSMFSRFSSYRFGGSGRRFSFFFVLDEVLRFRVF